MVNNNIKLNINEININNESHSDINTHSNNIHRLLDIVRKTYISIQKYKLLNIVNACELYSCIIALQNIALNLKNLLLLINSKLYFFY